MSSEKYEVMIFKNPHYGVIITSPDRHCITKHFYSGYPDIKVIKKLEVDDETQIENKAFDIIGQDICDNITNSIDFSIISYKGAGMYICKSGQKIDSKGDKNE